MGVSVVGEPVGDSEGPVVGLLVGPCVGTRLGCFYGYAFIKRKTSQVKWDYSGLKNETSTY